MGDDGVVVVVVAVCMHRHVVEDDGATLLLMRALVKNRFIFFCGCGIELCGRFFFAWIGKKCSGKMTSGNR